MYPIYFITSSSYDINTLTNKQSDLSELKNTNLGRNYEKQTDLNELLVCNMKVLLLAIILHIPLKEYVLAAQTKKYNKFVGILGNVNTVVAVFREKIDN